MPVLTGQVFSKGIEITAQIHIRKGLIRLALMHSDNLDNTARAKSYIVDTSSKCNRIYFPKERLFFIFDQKCS